MMSTSILLIGKPHSSKTVFLSQLYSKLQKNKSALKLYKSVEDLSPISVAREALAQGEEPQTTPSERSVKFCLPIQVGSMQVDLKCPEYGGEQVLSIVENRELNREWMESTKESNHWILFIRLNNLNRTLDISDITYSKENRKLTELTSEQKDFRISDQSFFIELFQILLNAKGNDYHKKNSSVKLTVALTCWDEMTAVDKPYEALKSKLPLLTAFLESNWHKDKLIVVGLSAQGFALTTPENKAKYQINGPEEFGYFVFPDGTLTSDITELIQQAII